MAIHFRNICILVHVMTLIASVFGIVFYHHFILLWYPEIYRLLLLYKYARMNSEVLFVKLTCAKFQILTIDRH